MTNGDICYAGLINKIQYKVDRESESQFLQNLVEKFLGKDNYDNRIHDLNIKYTLKCNNKNFINLTISNVRNFTIQGSSLIEPFPLPNESISTVGIQVILDVNDRRAFNEIKDYKCTLENINDLFKIAKDIINNKLDKIIESGKITL